MYLKNVPRGVRDMCRTLRRCEDYFLLERDMLIWVDETGSNSRDNGS